MIVIIEISLTIPVSILADKAGFGSVLKQQLRCGAQRWWAGAAPLTGMKGAGCAVAHSSAAVAGAVVLD